MPTRPRRKNFFRPARLPGELGLAASPLLYRERQDYLAAIRAALSDVKGARVKYVGVSDLRTLRTSAWARLSRRPKRASQRSLFLRADADLLMQCLQITEALRGHFANACSRLATKSHESIPALLRLPARRDKPVSAG
jgi:hypothetical protein